MLGMGAVNLLGDIQNADMFLLRVGENIPISYIRFRNSSRPLLLVKRSEYESDLANVSSASW
jgi:hypothetical protein